MPRSPKPVPPIYQPDVAADAIVWAIERPPRDLYVGFSTVAAVTASKLAPGLVDRYLARNGLEAQQTGEAVDPGRPDNLWSPVGGDHGARGRFDGEARPRSLHLWARTHRPAIGAAAAALAGLTIRRRVG